MTGLILTSMPPVFLMSSLLAQPVIDDNTRTNAFPGRVLRREYVKMSSHSPVRALVPTFHDSLYAIHASQPPKSR